MNPNCLNCGNKLCNCGGCHTCDNSGLENIQSIDPPVTAPEVRTQKARGMEALKNYRSKYVPKFKIYTAATVDPEKMVGKFVRPCPMRPRHGFVDSRLVATLDEAQGIIKETLAADPEAEFIIMDKIPAVYSGIWTPGHLAIGKGNDGATAGTSAITIPVLGDLFYHDEGILQEAGVEHAPYVELLYTESNPESGLNYERFEVQLRDGPKLEQQSEDYIPTEYLVKGVVKAEGDLLAWETRMKELPEGIVVWHPNGSLASHYSIHAVLNKIPVMITREPVIGEVLRPTQDAEPVKPNINNLRAGFQWATLEDMSSLQAGYLMLAGTHNIVVWQGKYDFLLGAAMGAAWRLTLTAAIGEARHAPEVNGHRRRRKLQRNTIYSRAWKITDRPDMRRKFQAAMKSFVDQRWNSSYGGGAWYNFSNWARMLHNELLNGNAEKTLEVLNSLVNSAHNSGWGFNKFMAESSLDIAAKAPVWAAYSCAPLLYKAVQVTDDEKQKLARRFIKYRREMKALRGPMVTEVQVKYQQPDPEHTAVKGIEFKTLHVQYKTNLTKQYATIDIDVAQATEETGYAVSTVQSTIRNAMRYWHKSNTFSGGKTEYRKAAKLHEGWKFGEILVMPLFMEVQIPEPLDEDEEENE